jgi:hypothetical protein
MYSISMYSISMYSISMYSISMYSISMYSISMYSISTVLAAAPHLDEAHVQHQQQRRTLMRRMYSISSSAAP